MLNTTGGSLPAGKYYLDSDLTLYALWRNVDYELDSLEAVLNATDKNALKKLEEGDVTVTALYKSSDGAYEQRVPLDWADLKLTYSSGNELHAAQPNVVTIEYGGKSVQVTVIARSPAPRNCSTSCLKSSASRANAGMSPRACRSSPTRSNTTLCSATRRKNSSCAR